MSKNVIVVPTYNEMGNIEITLKKIENLKYNFDVVVVDDNSPDGTGDFVQKAISNKTTNFLFEPNLNLIYFQPDMSNIRIALSLSEPNKFRSMSSILNSPHSLTISLGLIEGLTEYSYVLLTYVF